MCTAQSVGECWSKKFIGIATLLWAATVAFGSSTFSQDPAARALDLRRVFVPQQDLPMIGPNHVPINLKDLESLLAKRREKEQSAERSAINNLDESIYVAEVIGKELVSYASRFRLSSDSHERTLIPVEPCSFAIKSAAIPTEQLLRYSTKEHRLLSSEAFHSTMDGRLQLEIAGKSDLWFAWSSQGEVQFDSNRIRFQIDYPACIANRMLVKLPPQWRISDSSSVVSSISDPVDILQSEWPGLERESLQSENWWLLELSGDVHLSFEIDRTNRRASSSFDVRVTDEHIDYQLRPGSLEVQQTLGFDSQSFTGDSVFVTVPAELRVESITLNDEAVRWIANGSGDAVEIYPTSKLLNSESKSQLKIRGLSSYPSPSSNKSLPYFDLKRHFTTDGSVSLSIPIDWNVTDLHFSDSPQYTRHETAGLQGTHQWQWRWTGRPPEIRLDAIRTVQRGAMNTLSRLTNEKDGLDCTSWVSIDPKRSLTSVLHMRMPNGWTLDSVQSLDRRCTAIVERKGPPETGYYEIALTPPITTPATIEIRSRAAWTSPGSKADASENIFRGEKPFIFPDWEQRDEFWVEPIGRYKLEPNPNLIQSVIAENDVIEQHRSRLPRIGGVWLIRPTGSSLPELRFIGEQSPYNTQLETSLIPGLDSVVAEYRLRCTPLAGAISSITVDLAKSPLTSLRWRQKIVDENGIETWTPLESRDSSIKGKKLKLEGSKSGERLQVDILLKTPFTETVELEARAEIFEQEDKPSDAWINLPIITFPEAAQQIAMILVDRRLGLEEQTGSNAFSPAGYTTLSTGFEGLKYVYDPIRISQLSIQPRKQTASPVWLANVVSRYQFYASGDQTLSIFGRLHSESTDSLSFSFPNEWRVRSARCNGKDLLVGPANDSNSHFVIWIPKYLKTQSGLDFEITMDGPESPVVHCQPIHFPEWKVDASIVSHQSEIWLPKSASLGQLFQANAVFSRPTFETTRLLPSVWWTSLSQQNTEHFSRLSPSATREIPGVEIPETQPWLAWSSSSDRGEAGRQPLVLGKMSLLLKESVESENWLRVFLGLSIALCLSAWRASLLPIGFILSVIILFVVQPTYLPAFQQFALGWFFAGTLRLINSTFSIRPTSDDIAQTISQSVPRVVERDLANPFPSHLSSLTRSTNVTPLSVIGLISFFAIGMGHSACDGEDSNEVASDRFDIILPVDEQGLVASPVAYVPEKLLQVLNGSRDAKQGLNSVLSAEYELSLTATNSSEHHARWVSRIDLNIAELRHNVVLPLDSKYSDLISVRVNGESVALGNRLRWDGKDLYWTPSKLGAMTLEMTFTPKIRAEEDGTESVLVDLMPIPFSKLMIELDGFVDLQTNAAGATMDKSIGRTEIELGPITQFNARWRSQEYELKQAPQSVTAATEIALLGSQLLAKTVISKATDTVWPKQLEIECNAAWQPIDRQMGDYWIYEEVPASFTNRRRYRFVRSDWFQHTASIDESLALYWTTPNPQANIVVAPVLDLMSLRITESLLHVMQSEDAAWELDGLQGWEAAPSKKSFDWQTRRDVSLLSYRRLHSAATPFLKKVNQSEPVSVDANTELQFGADQVASTTIFRFATPAQLTAGFAVTLTSPQTVTQVLIGNRQTPFSLSDSASKLTILPHSRSERVESIEIRSTQNYLEDEWRAIPLAVIQGIPLKTHSIRATRLAGHQFHWTGVTPEPTADAEQAYSLRTHLAKAEDLYVPAWNWDLSMARDAVRSKPESKETLSDGSIHQTWPQYRLTDGQGVHRGYGCIEMSRQSKHWTCTVLGRIEPNGRPIDGVLLELPANLLPQLDSKHKVYQFKSPETGRGLVFLFAEEMKNGEPFQFQFSTIVSGVDDQSTISVPDIQWLGNVDWSTWICIPPSVAGQDARWTWSGASREDKSVLPEFLSKQIQTQLNDGLLLSPTARRPQVRLTEVATNHASVDLNLVDHRLRSSHGTFERLRSTFWLVPRGHSSLSVQFPKNLEFIAAECNGQVIQHRLETIASNKPEHSVELQLLSSSLPQRLLVYFNVRDSGTSPMFWPRIPNAPTAKTLVSSDLALATDAEFRSINQEEWISLESEAAWDVVEKAASIVAEIPLRERLQWWDDWQRTNANAWRRTVMIRDQGKFEEVLKRHRVFCDRFQLPSISLTTTKANDLAFVESASLTHYYESIGSSSSENSREIHVANMSPKNNSTIRLALPWLALLAMISLAIKWTCYAFDCWHDQLPRYLSYRPWWLWTILGILGYSIAPSWWLGPCTILVALFLAIRGAWQAHRFRQLAAG
jgi:hypothetical protein